MALVSDNATYQPLPEDATTDGKAQYLKTAETAIRMGFLRKVYSILAIQLMVTVAVATPFVMYGETFVKSHQTLVSASVIPLFASLLAMTCCPSVTQKFPQNYIILSVFTLSQGVLVGCVCAAYTWQSVGLAAGVTAFVFVALTAYAFTTKTDFTGFGPYLFAGLMVMCTFGLILSILAWCGVAVKAAMVCYDIMGVLLFTFYIIYDTQMIIGGDHKVQFTIDDYVFAALNLYLDIINLFLYILELIGDRK